MKRIILNVFLAGLFLLLTSPHGFAQEHHHAHGGGAPGLDEKQPMVAIMQGMNTSLNSLTSAIVSEDYPLIASSAYNIANHPGITQEDLDKLFERLGSKKEAFIVCDNAVHLLAMDVSKAGEQRDMDIVLEKYSAMLAKTVECHREYRRH